MIRARPRGGAINTTRHASIAALAPPTASIGDTGGAVLVLFAVIISKDLLSGRTCLTAEANGVGRQRGKHDDNGDSDEGFHISSSSTLESRATETKEDRQHVTVSFFLIA